MVLIIDTIRKRIRGYTTVREIREMGLINGSIESENRKEAN